MSYLKCYYLHENVIKTYWVLVTLMCWKLMEYRVKVQMHVDYQWYLIYFFNIVIQSILCCINIKRYGFLVYLACNRWGNNSHVLKTIIWTVFLLVHNKIFCWKFSVFSAHYRWHFFHSENMLNLNNFTLLKSPWLCNGGSFSTRESKANFHNHSGNHDPAHPQNTLVLLVLVSPKDWHATRCQTGGVNTI